jgi:hypothetical protein
MLLFICPAACIENTEVLYGYNGCASEETQKVCVA